MSFISSASKLVAISLASTLIIAPLAAKSKHDSETETAKLNAIADEFLAKKYENSPERTTILNLENARNDLFNDHSVAAEKRFQEYQDELYSRLKTIDKSVLSREARINYETIFEDLESSRDSRICHSELWSIDSYYPWFASMANLATEQPLKTDKNKQDALTRWKKFADVAQAETDNLRQGLATGYSAPRAVLDGVLNQLDGLLAEPIKESPFFLPNNGETSEEYKKEFYSIVKDIIYPELEKFRDYLVNEYMPNARTEIGVAALPDGEACYHEMIRKNTTKQISATQIYLLGFMTINELLDRLTEISEKHFNGMSTRELLDYASKKTKGFKSEKDVLDYNYAALDRVKAILPKLMTVSPKSDFVIKPYPLFRAKAGAAGEYHLPSRDGVKPGIFYINTYDYENMAYADLESTLFHEAIPGHHLQLSLLIENEKIHPIVESLMSSASAEGWGLYAEQLASEFELFSDPLAEVGYISSMLFRASRLVLDPGLHVFGWSKQEAIDFLKQYTVLPDNIVESEIDRYLTWPGQATGYYLGLYEILEAREYAQAELGDKFSLPAFNDYILAMSPVPLEFIKQDVKNWVDQQK